MRPLLSVLMICFALVAAGPQSSFTLKRSIPLEGVTGRIDHIALDPNMKRLFVAALANGSLEMIDLEKGERVKSATGLKEPQGIAYVLATGQVVVACGGDGTVRAFDAATLDEKLKVDLGEDADNVRLLGDGRTLVVGYSSGALALLEAATLTKTGDIALPGHPESFQIEPDEKNGVQRVFVNVPDAGTQSAGSVVVADLRTMTTLTTWPLKDAGRNYPMALDNSNKRLYVGCRHPAKLIVLDTTDGKAVASLECVSDADDIFVSRDGSSVFVIGGGGTIDVFMTTDHVAYAKTNVTQTASGARTGLAVLESQVLYVAVPKGDGHSAEIRQYDLAK